MCHTKGLQRGKMKGREERTKEEHNIEKIEQCKEGIEIKGKKESDFLKKKITTEGKSVLKRLSPGRQKCAL